MSDRAGLASPIWRLAAVTGEEPALVALALSRLIDAGWTFDQVWDYLGTLTVVDSIVDACDAVFDGRL